ncbi:MAG: hypothetical protein QOH10_397 [Actinomycetota bacterium]|jgi:hypothetical protein|nr:hypothetical protein [Actinomycetota bacterium]
MDALSAREVAILDFEREWALATGPKEPTIRQRFAVSPTTYYRALSALIARRDAYEHDPLTVLRLRRLREQRRRSRIEGNRTPAGPRAPAGPR